MATEIVSDVQSKGEIRTYFCDFTDDLPGSITIASATATHTPPSGLATTPTVVVASPEVRVTFGPVSVTGQHSISVLATLSDGEKSELKLLVPVQW
jgi:hypothetical protein